MGILGAVVFFLHCFTLQGRSFGLGLGLLFFLSFFKIVVRVSLIHSSLGLLGK